MNTYSVLLHGSAESTNESKESLKTRLAETFGVSAAALEIMLQTPPVVLKRNVPYEQAEQYAQVLRDLGAAVEVRSETVDDNDCLFPDIKAKNAQPQNAELSSSSLALDEEQSVSSSQPSDPQHPDNWNTGLSLEDSPTQPTPQKLPDQVIDTTFSSSEKPESPLLHSQLERPTPEEKATPSSSQLPQENLPVETPQSEIPSAHIDLTWKGEIAPPSKTYLVLFTVVLALAAWFFFNYDSTDGSQSASESPAIEKLLQEQNAIRHGSKNSKKSAEDRLPAPTSWSGKQEDQSTTSLVSLTLRGDTVEEAELNITSAEPPKLTPQEIVDHVTRSPWIRKLDDFLPETVTREAEELVVHGRAKLYLQDDIGNSRVVCTVVLRLRSTPQGTGQLTWFISHGITPTDPGAENFIRRTNLTSFEVSYSGTIPVSKRDLPPPTLPPQGLPENAPLPGKAR